MRWTTPLWLIALLPWAGVVLYLLWRRRKRVRIPFLQLWRGVIPARTTRHTLAPPTVAVMLAMVAMLLALIGAGGPALRREGVSGDEPITLIIDRGLTMSALQQNQPRFVERSRALGTLLEQLASGRRRIELYAVPANDGRAFIAQTDALHLASIVARLSPTAQTAREPVRELARRQLARTRGPVLVVSDADLSLHDDRLVQIVPSQPIENTGITAIAARLAPRTQVMVRIRNDSDRRTAQLGVQAAGQTIARAIDLPRRGASRDYFVDVPSSADVTFMAEVTPADELPADDRAWLIARAWPFIQVATPPGELQRLIDTYRTLRPTAQGSPLVKIVKDVQALGNAPGVIIHSAIGAATAQSVRPTWIEPHPITDAVSDWSRLDLPVGTDSPAPVGWKSILAANGRTLVATRQTPARQVWVAMDTDRWANRPEYVVFWSALLDWAGHGGEIEPAKTLDQWTPDWRPVTTMPAGMDIGQWPGIYERSDGTRAAFNAPVATPPSIVLAQWSDRLPKVLAANPKATGWRDLSPLAMVAAIAAVAGAAITWRRI